MRKRVLPPLLCFLLLCISMNQVFAGEIHRGIQNWHPSFEVSYDDNQFTLTNIEVQADEDLDGIQITFPEDLNLQEEQVPEGWAKRTETPTSVYYRTPTHNDSNSLQGYLASLVFKGEFGTEGKIGLELYESRMGSWLDSNDVRHYYEYVPFDEVGGYKTWSESYNLAKQRTYKGLTGYLATITSQPEQDYITNSIADNTYWLSGISALTADSQKILDSKQVAPWDQMVLPGDDAVWYWAAGPEAGTAFWNGLTYLTGTGAIENQFNYWKPSTGVPEPNTKGHAIYICGSDEIGSWGMEVAGGWYELPAAEGPQEVLKGFMVEYSAYNGMVEDAVSSTFEASLPLPIVETPIPEVTSIPVEVEEEPEIPEAPQENKDWVVTFLNCEGETLSVQKVPNGEKANPVAGYVYEGTNAITFHTDFTPSNCEVKKGYQAPNTGVDDDLFVGAMVGLSGFAGLILVSYRYDLKG